MIFITPDRKIQAYRLPDQNCNNCQHLIFLEARWNEKGGIETKDGMAPNGQYPSNVRWFVVDSLSKEDHKCQ